MAAISQPRADAPSRYNFLALLKDGQAGNPDGFQQGDIFEHIETRLRIQIQRDANGAPRAHAQARENYYYLNGQGNPLVDTQGSQFYSSGPKGWKPFLDHFFSQPALEKASTWDDWQIIRAGDPVVTLTVFRENWFRNRQAAQAGTATAPPAPPVPNAPTTNTVTNTTDTQPIDDNNGDDDEEMEDANAATVHMQGPTIAGAATAATGTVNQESQIDQDIRADDDSSDQPTLSHNPQTSTIPAQPVPNFVQDPSANNSSVSMAPNDPYEGLIDPALLAHDQAIGNASAQAPPVAQGAASSDVTMTCPPPAAPANVLEPIRQSVENAASAWFQRLPADQQQRLPSEPIQALRVAITDTDAIMAWNRNASLTNAMQAANNWYNNVSAGMRGRLPPDAFDALQSAVLRLTASQPNTTNNTGADVNTTNTQPIGHIAQSFAESHKAAVKRLEEWE